MNGQLEGKIAVITGASSGIGRAIAVGFAREGAQVTIADITEQPIEGGPTTVELIARAHAHADYERTDISCWEDVDGLISRTVARHGRLDIMVNNAGVETRTSILDTTEAQYEKVLAINLHGKDHAGQVFEVHLVADAHPRRHG